MGNIKHYDIALGELSIALDLSKEINNNLDDHLFDVQPICVGKNKHGPRDVYVAGWGITGMRNFCITDKHGYRPNQKCMPKWTYNGKTHGGMDKSPCTNDPADLRDLAFWSKKTGTKRKKNKRCTKILKQFGTSMWDKVDYVKVFNKRTYRGKCLFPKKSIKDYIKEERILKEINNSGRTKVAWFPYYCATCDP